MQMTSSQAILYLENIYRSLNIKFFNGELRDVIITLSSKESTNHAIKFDKESISGKKNVVGIEFNVNCINKPIEQTVANIMHEMVHEYCRENNIKCGTASYHNEKFRQVADSHGLISSPSESKGGYPYGWGTSTANDELLAFIDQQGWKQIDVTGISFYKKKHKPFVRRWTCPVCGRKYETRTRDAIPACGNCKQWASKEFMETS